LVFPQLFSKFRWSNGYFATLATFSIAFYRDLLAQPFGHYGDKIGRKFFGCSVIDYGNFDRNYWLLPSYASIGIAALVVNVSFWSRYWFRRRMGRRGTVSKMHRQIKELGTVCFHN
jgi:hypothetical protein